MRPNILRKPIFLSFIILASLGLICYIVYDSLQKLLASEEQVRHTEQVIYKSDNILSLAKDIVIASQGFLIAKDSSFLDSLTNKETIISTYIGEIRQMTLDNAPQQQRIDSLNYYIHRHLDLINHTTLAGAYARDDKKYTDRIQIITGDIQREEGVLLRERKEMNRQSLEAFNRYSIIVFIIMAFFTCLLLIAASNYYIQKNEKDKRAAELIVSNKNFIFQNEEKEKRAAELIIANRELLFQNNEKEKRAAELIIANTELAFQNLEKEKRAAELIIANQELLFQNEEKEKRAAELIIANTELAFQNEEKEKRAAELIIANQELVFQNEEKEKRAAELIIANTELAFQNEEKEKRAAELIIANKELVFQNEEKEKRAAELVIINKELKNAEDDIRKLNEELEYKVTERTEQLKTANTELESFSYSVSHDLRAPIRAISGYAQILEEDHGGKLDDDGTTILHSIRHNAKKMGHLIDDLLAFSQLGRKQVTVLEINMQALVTPIIKELTQDDTDSRIEFNEFDLPPAKGDPSLLKQVWINLLSNAIKYSKYRPKSIIEIGAYKKDNSVIYYVKDNGAGFDMQYYDKLFGVFQRLHSQDEFEGTGIGLAIVQKIVHRHNGTVWAESKEGEGTSFYFSLPDIHS